MKRVEVYRLECDLLDCFTGMTNRTYTDFDQLDDAVEARESGAFRNPVITVQTELREEVA